MNRKWIAVLLGISLVVGVYFTLDPENTKLDDKERKKLGGSYLRLSNGVTHYSLTCPIDGILVVLVHGGTIPVWT